MAEFFVYEPLQPRQIRVLEVEASTDPSSLVRCRCLHVSLEDSSRRPPYTAVSYTWGSGEKTHQLLINGHPLPITQNAHDIFRSKLMNSSESLLWIDAVCINQDDGDEKARQVGMMGEVYSHAECVRVWLGPEAENSKLAIDFIKVAASILPEIASGDMERTSYYAARYPEEAPEWSALAILLDRPWFTRTWVIQEVALAKHAEIVCGDDRVNWDILAGVVNGCIALGLSGMIAASPHVDLLNIRGMSGLERVYKLSSVCDCRKRGEEIILFELMILFSHSKTIDQRDKVYGFLGIATDGDNPVFAPDYTKSPVTLFAEVSRSVIQRDSRLGCLRWAGIEEESGSVGLPILPSWAFNFADKIRPKCLGNYPVMPSTNYEIAFSGDGNELRSKGIIFDSIVSLGSTSIIVGDGHLPGKGEIANIYAWYMEAKEIFQSTCIQDDEVFWRTVVGNKIDDDSLKLDQPEEAPGPEYGEFAKAFERIAAQFDALHALDNKAANQLFLSEEGSKALNFRQALFSAVSTRHFCVLNGGSVGLVPERARPGDLVAAFLGAMILFVVRPLPVDEGVGQRYQLVGECYVHGMMNGKVIHLGLETEDIVLV